MSYFTEEYKEEAFKFINNKMSYINTIDYISYGGDGECSFTRTDMEAFHISFGTIWFYQRRRFPDKYTFLLY